MRKSKYGEETVVIRVPVSCKKYVEDYISNFEVLGHRKGLGRELCSASDLSYKKGFSDGFRKGEEYQYSLSYALADASQDEIKLAIELFRGRIPDIALTSCFERLSTILLASDVDVSGKQVPFSTFLGLTNQ